MGFIIFVVLVAIIFIPIAFVLISQRSSKGSPTSYYASTAEDDIRTPSRTRLSADVSKQLRSDIDDYCSRHSITISELIRRAIESYIYSDQDSSSVNTVSLKTAPARSVVRSDGTWKCPRCKKINASYVGTCSCGKSKE